jgi:hypothetical protein
MICLMARFPTQFIRRLVLGTQFIFELMMQCNQMITTHLHHARRHIVFEAPNAFYATFPNDSLSSGKSFWK